MVAEDTPKMAHRAQNAHLEAGIAAVSITPDRHLPLEGYGVRAGSATGTLDALEAQAIVFADGARRVALVSVDLCGLESASVNRVRAIARRACGIPEDNVLIAFSHTHSAPAVTAFAGVDVDTAYLGWLEARLAQVVVEASQRLQPVTLGVGAGSLGFTVNRRRRTPDGMVLRANPQGLVDQRVRVLRLDPAEAPAPPGTLGGRPLAQADPVAVLFAYACHPTVLGGQNYRYSADYPGAARRFVEQAYTQTAVPASVGTRQSGAGRQSDSARTRAMFLPPCFGNLRPHLLRPDGGFREGTVHELQVLGRLLGSEVVQVAEQIVSEPLTHVAIGRREVWLPYAHVATAAELRTALEGPRRWWARRLLDRWEHDGEVPQGERVEVQVLRLGRHWLIALPGETTLEIGASIERGLVELGLAQPERGDLTLALGYTNGYVGYLCAASLIAEGGYEPGDYASYGRPGPFAYEIEPQLVNTALALAQEIGPVT